MRQRAWLCCLLVVGSLVLSVTPAAAQASTVTLSPTTEQLTLNPGLLQATSEVTLSNTTSYTITADISLRDFSPSGSNGAIVLGTPGIYSGSGLAKWMALPHGSHIVVPAGHTAQIPLVIDNRSDLTPGGHYGAVVFSTVANGGSGSNKVLFSQQLVSLLFVKKVGGDVEGMSLSSFTIDRTHGTPSTATLTFKSTGNVYVIPRGFITATDSHGKLLAKGVINTTSSLIPQGSARTFKTSLLPIDGASITGRVTLTAYYRYDGENTYHTKTQHLAPLTARTGKTLLIIIGLIILGIGIGLLRYLNWRSRRRWRTERMNRHR